jgi:ribosomal protein S18 acetylase RimI-like enzyme
VTTALPGQDTLIACWNALAETSAGAQVHQSPRAVVATFPSWLPLNNAVVLDGDPATPSVVAPEVARVYADAGVDVWALWVPSWGVSFDDPDRVLEIAGLERDTTTLVMQSVLSPRLRAHDEVVEASLAAIVRLANEEPVPAHELGAPETTPGLSAWALVVDGVAVVGAWTFLHREDCGIYAVGTLPAFRRRGFARTLMEHVLGSARRRGARTASLQSTRMGQPLYESLGFTPVGRYEEWIRG